MTKKTRIFNKAIDTEFVSMLIMERSLTYAELAKESGLSYPTISHAMNGHSVTPRTIGKLAKFFKVEPSLISKVKED